MGVNFENGLANPEINKGSGEVVYLDNRPIITRNSEQRHQNHLGILKMAQKTNLNISPYFDDFDPNNQFYKVLFKLVILFKQEN